MHEHDAPDRRTVTLVDVPVDLYRRAQQHTDDLLREVVLMAEHEALRGRSGRATGLARRARGHHRARVELTVSAAPHVDAARDRGDDHVTLTYQVDPGHAASSDDWRRLLDELDGLCRDGTLLTVPASEDVALFTAWFCGEFVHQLRDGQPPCPWPHFARSRRHAMS